MYSRKILFLVMSLGVSSGAFCQTRISGKVCLDSLSNELPGVIVLEEHSHNSTVTMLDGTFQLTVKDSSLIRFSFVGCLDTIIAANKIKQDTIVLKSIPVSDSDIIYYCPVDYARSFTFGYFGDFRRLPYGISLTFFRPYLFRKAALLSGRFLYKTNFESDFDYKISLSRGNIIGHVYYALGALVEYQNRKVIVHRKDYQAKDFCFVLSNSFSNVISVSPGLVYRVETVTETESYLGWFFSADKHFWKWNQELEMHLTIFPDYSEFGLGIYQKLSTKTRILNRFQIGLLYEGYHKYDDVSLLLRYKP